MYRPAFHRLDDREAMLRLIAFHCPFLLDRASGPHGALRGHFAQDEVEAHAVPTWNYALVHAHGAVRWSADREGTVKGLNALGTDAARTMAALVRQALDDSPH